MFLKCAHIPLHCLCPWQSSSAWNTFLFVFLPSLMPSSLSAHSTLCLKSISHHYQNSNGIFYRTRTNNSQICMEPQRIPNGHGNLEKEEECWRYHIPWFQTIVQSYSHQNGIVLALKTDIQINGNEWRAQKETHAYMINEFIMKEQRTYYWERTVSLINDVEETGQTYAKEWN